MSEFPRVCSQFDRSSSSVSREPALLPQTSLTSIPEQIHSQICHVRNHSSILLGPLQNSKDDAIIRVTSMKDLMEKRLASMVDRPWARQLWAMKPAFSSARHIASSPSFQFQLGMFSRWALIALTVRRGHKMKKTGENGSLDQ